MIKSQNKTMVQFPVDRTAHKNNFNLELVDKPSKTKPRVVFAINYTYR